MYMFILVCDLTEVFFIAWKRRFYPECYLFLWPVFCCLVIQSAFRCLTYLDLTQCRSDLSFFVCLLLFLFSLLMVVYSFTVIVENKLNMCGVLTFEFVCVHVQVMYAKLLRP